MLFRSFFRRLAFLREGDKKFRLQRRGNFFIGEQFHGGMDLRFIERLRGSELFYERCEHTRILRGGAKGTN